LRIAACHSKLALHACSQSRNSSNMIEGWTPVMRLHAVTLPRVSDTTASYGRPVSLSSRMAVLALVLAQDARLINARLEATQELVEGLSVAWLDVHQ
jgi:hypothetical protein